MDSNLRYRIFSKTTNGPPQGFSTKKSLRHKNCDTRIASENSNFENFRETFSAQTPFPLEKVNTKNTKKFKLRENLKFIKIEKIKYILDTFRFFQMFFFENAHTKKICENFFANFKISRYLLPATTKIF